MRFRKSKEEEPQLGITPLIDIVFLLLIFFMLTSHFHVASGVPIRLPEVTQKSHDEEAPKVIIVIDREGQIYLKGQKTSLKELDRKIRKLVKKDGVVYLLLQADEEVRHGKVVQVMDLAKGAGVSSILIAAQWEPGKVF